MTTQTNLKPQTDLKSQTSSLNTNEFLPPFGLRSPHVQTIFSSLGPRKFALLRKFAPFKHHQQEVILQTADGVRLQGFYNIAKASQPAAAKSKQLVILIHGWEGCHESSYMLSMASTLLNEGIDVFRLNLRDHGATHHLNEGLFNSTMIKEVIQAISELQKSLDYSEYVLGGFSLGGNFALRVAAQAHDCDVSLNKCVVFCPVVNASDSNEELLKSQNRVYGKYFVRKWKRSLTKKLEHFPDYGYANILDSLKTLDQLNACLIPQYTPYQEIEDYFKAYAINDDAMSKTICPCYLHFSRDDMIIPISGASELADNPDLHINITDRGGHCGYLMNWKLESWQDQRMLQLAK